MRIHWALLLVLFSAEALAQVKPKAPAALGTNKVGITLQWDASVSTDVTGYKFYYGTKARTYGTPVDVGNVLTYYVVGLPEGTYFFAVTAYNTTAESDFSNEVQTTILGTAPAGPVGITGPMLVTIAATSATLSWRTPTAMDSRIEYQYTGGPFTSLVVDTAAQATTDHFVRIASLSANKVYQYTVICTGGGVTLTATGSFRTR